ncbi:coactosin [Anaeramoeba flamelloides]|uniref:Coactosin n=1 Tax=Anaeramoeba flamelloides TaxID=1746091 RepID=A0AAV7YFD3_9EUKA|nr:coactosin [Anaeramoeba flamelloides]KAJ6238577.1 coactosin [Anaeramoeba flamelloides]
MANVEDPAIEEAYNDVRDDNTETNWMACGYVGKTNDLEMIGSGSGGIDEMKSLFDPTLVIYGYLRVIAGDEESKRPKFVFVVWVGENCGVMRRARVSVHKSDVKKVIKQFAVEWPGTELSEFEYEDIMKQVRKVGGADYQGNW